MVNDCAERAFVMATSLHGPTTPKNEKQLQATYKVIDVVRKFQRCTATSSERVIKRALADFLSYIFLGSSRLKLLTDPPLVLLNKSSDSKTLL